MVIKGAFFAALIENVSFLFHFQSADGAIGLATSAPEAQLTNTTQISAPERVFSQRLLGMSCNVVRHGVNSTQARVSVRSASGATACGATEAGGRGWRHSTKGLKVVHPVMMLGI